VAQYTIILTFGAAVAIETNLSAGLDPLLLGSALVIINLSILALAIGLAFRRYRKETRLRLQAKWSQASRLEPASGFTAGKFATTLDAVARNHVPPSSCLAFWYATAGGARRALRSGIASRDQASKLAQGAGVVLTLHQPHELDAFDEAYFPYDTRDAVLCCALPLHLLQRLPGDATESAVRVLSGAVLLALRGSYFGSLLNPNPWFNGQVLLPPHQVRNSRARNGTVLNICS
jgi:hypothetical protein